MNNIPEKDLFTIEVEYDNENLSVDIYNSIIKTVSELNGLQLLLITGDDKPPIKERNMADFELSISYVLTCQDQISKLVAAGEYSSAFLSLWLFAELLMERLTRQTSIPTERVSSILMIHHLYQQSIISQEQFETALQLDDLRDKLSQNYSKDLDVKQEIERLRDLVDDFIALEVRAYPLKV